MQTPENNENAVGSNPPPRPYQSNSWLGVEPNWGNQPRFACRCEHQLSARRLQGRRVLFRTPDTSAP